MSDYPTELPKAQETYEISSDQMFLTVNGKTTGPANWRYINPLARTDDPATSKAAAEKCAQFRNKHEVAILEALAFFGASGGTAKEIAQKIQLTDVQVNRRLAGLEKAGKIVTTGAVRYGCRAWRAK